MILTKSQEIEGILSYKINEHEICKYIIRLVKDFEIKEAMEYHYKLWEDISIHFYNSFENYKKYESKNLQESELFIKCDLNLKVPIDTYYLRTGYSCLSRIYLLDLLSKKSYIFNCSIYSPILWLDNDLPHTDECNNINNINNIAVLKHPDQHIRRRVTYKDKKHSRLSLMTTKRLIKK